MKPPTRSTQAATKTAKATAQKQSDREPTCLEAAGEGQYCDIALWPVVDIKLMQVAE